MVRSATSALLHPQSRGHVHARTALAPTITAATIAWTDGTVTIRPGSEMKRGRSGKNISVKAWLDQSMNRAVVILRIIGKPNQILTLAAQIGRPDFF